MVETTLIGLAMKMMEQECSEKHTGDESTAWLVTAPAMLKTGKSSGEDLDTEILLLKMAVSCESAAVTLEGQGK